MSTRKRIERKLEELGLGPLDALARTASLSPTPVFIIQPGDTRIHAIRIPPYDGAVCFNGLACFFDVVTLLIDSVVVDEWLRGGNMSTRKRIEQKFNEVGLGPLEALGSTSSLSPMPVFIIQPGEKRMEVIQVPPYDGEVRFNGCACFFDEITLLIDSAVVDEWLT